MESSVLSILVGLWLVTCFGAAEEEPIVPAMYLFGDLLADAGNNNYIPNCTARANFTPYGISFFPCSTGRFTDGRTAFDFVADRLGLSYPPPYLQPNARFTRGINFASGSSGLLDSTGVDKKVISMSEQLFMFEQYSNNLTNSDPSGGAQANLRKSLFGITVGGNDIGSYIANTTASTEFVTLLLAKFNQTVVRLYNGGARKFLIFNIPPVGCTPYTKYTGYNISHGECLDAANQLATAYNSGSKSLVTLLNEKLDGVSIIQLNAYDHLMTIIQNPQAFGFSDSKSACCGSGLFNAEVSCGKTSPQNMFCGNISTRVLGWISWYSQAL
ncbi:GDSL esterase/lipase At2g23540 [Cryptomeria japonica]|uniref:GDSL esterase/lipase At2g23540 n=1 Tax=Cryptomeria japonica TaxID=3369 RepID=UPI0027DA3D9D|nr:GDSL esterase/lipase At2g23540 [Cryptomeria japonica]